MEEINNILDKVVKNVESQSIKNKRREHLLLLHLNAEGGIHSTLKDVGYPTDVESRQNTTVIAVYDPTEMRKDENIMDVFSFPKEDLIVLHFEHIASPCDAICIMRNQDYFAEKKKTIIVVFLSSIRIPYVIHYPFSIPMDRYLEKRLMENQMKEVRKWEWKWIADPFERKT